jgi:hypothetical protein
MKKTLTVSLAALTVMTLALFSSGNFVSGQSAESTPSMARAEALCFADESLTDLTEKIAKYCETQHQLKLRRDSINNMAILAISFTANNGVDCTVFVSSESVRVGEVVRVRLVSYRKLPDEMKTPEAQMRVMKVTNKFLDEYTAPDRVYLDGDGDIVLQSFVTIPTSNVPVHAECVYDKITDLAAAWDALNAALEEGLAQ